MIYFYQRVDIINDNFYRIIDRLGRKEDRLDCNYKLLLTKYFQSQMQERKHLKLIQLIDQRTQQTEPYILELDLVGKGYYGAVYKAVHQYDSKRVYAVKVITLKRQQTRQQILKQLQIIRKIPRSPNLVDTHKQHLQSARHLYIFQEFCEGGTLSELAQKMQGKMIREDFAFDLFYQLSRGYIDLYEAGIIHEDIKPANILIKGKLYKYCDFGVSKFASKLKYEDSRKGTVSYMPPQKLLSKFKPSARSDIFSLGVTLYQVIFGMHPYLKKKTKNTKQYLTTLHHAQLAPSHQLMRRIYNPSVRFGKLINLIEGMISRKVEMRMTIEELRDVVFAQEPFKGMTVPVESDNKQLMRDYSKLEISPYMAQSKIFVIPTAKQKDNNNKSNPHQQQQQKQEQFQNRLFPSYKIQLQQSSQYKAQLSQQLRLDKIAKQYKRKVLEEMFREYHCVQAVIGYVNHGVRVLREVYRQVESNAACGDTYFTQTPFTLLPSSLIYENPCQLLTYLTLKLSVNLMSTFSKSIENYQKFHQQIPIWQEIQYLQAEETKFIADNTNIKEKEVKKGLITVCREMKVEDYCRVIPKQLRQIFQSMVLGNCVRRNFKDDLMNGIFLLHVSQVLHNLQQLPTITSPQHKSSSSSATLALQQIQLITKHYNQLRTLSKDKLIEHFQNQIESMNGGCIIYDIQQNSDEFTLLQDNYIDEDQQQEDECENKEISSGLFQKIEIDQIDCEEQCGENRNMGQVKSQCK